MSKSSESLRAKAKEKANRLANADPHQRVDASSWTPPEAMNTGSQTGMRVLSRRAFKRGGSVLIDGSHAINGGRKPRKSGGSIDSYMNRNEKEANEERVGTKHVGGMARGGHADEAQDKKLIKSMMHKANCSCSKCSGGRVGRKSGGRTKKGTNINIIIAPQGGGGGGPKPPMAPPGPPTGGPVGLHQAPPPVPPAGAPPPMGGAGMPPMPRKSGGRAYPITDGAGGGEGRLQKARAYGGK